MTSIERISYRKSKGLCPRCGKPNTSDKYICVACREYDRETRKLFLRYRVCPVCRKNELLGDEHACPECRAKLIENNIKARERNPQRAKKNKDKANLKYREKMRAQGLCYCGRKKGDKRFAYCERCRLKMAEKARLKREKKDA